MPNPKVCAICGWRKATTKDHLPPRGVFPKPLPVQMRTVPACSECNNGAAQSDERFRMYLAAMTAHFNDDATRLWREGVMRTLANNQRLQRELAAAMRNTVAVEVRPGVFEDRIRIVMPVAAYNPTIERIIRGLYYHHFEKALGSRGSVAIELLYRIPDEAYEAVAADGWQGGDVGGQQFVYRFAYVDDIRTVWILQFFETTWAFAETYPVGGKRLSDIEAADEEGAARGAVGEAD